MRRQTGAELRIATAEGPGSGRFFARALLDVLEAGAWLAGVQVQPATRTDGNWAIDFTFCHAQSERGEVVRAGLDRVGSVVSAELLRTSLQLTRRYRRTPALASAIRAEANVQTLRLESGAAGEPRAVRLDLSEVLTFAIDLAEFDPAFSPR